MLEILFWLIDGAEARAKIREEWNSKNKVESPTKKKNKQGRLKYKEGKEVQYWRSAVLREMLQLPEVFMSAREWSSVSYNRVASVAMKKYTDIFEWHDKERFTKYFQDVGEGKEKIAAGALLPHDIVSSCMNDDQTDRTVAELQWKRLVDDMLEKGKLSNCIAVCDVSGIMSGTPMDVAVALDLLVSELSEEP